MTEALCLYPSGCGGCGGPVPPRRVRWCSDGCRTAWYINHLWRWARPEALRRANREGFRARPVCVGCGGDATEVDHIEERRGVPLHQPTCLHHQDNLRALCHGCHVNRRTVFGETSDSDPALPLDS